MKKTRFTETQIVAILGEANAGMKVKDICRKHGISDATYYNWKAKYGGMGISELKRTKELGAENAKLKRMYADLALENRAMKAEQGLSIQRGCACVGLAPATFYRSPVDWSVRDSEVITVLNELVEAHPRWGFWKYARRCQQVC